jgi:hypothetical protein
MLIAELGGGGLPFMVMKRFLSYSVFTSSLAVLACSVFSNAYAQTESISSLSDMSMGPLRDEVIGFKPQIGFLNYDDVAENGFTTMTVGINSEINVLKFFKSNLDKKIFGGFESGITYSHLSSSSSTLLYAPLNIKVGYMVTDWLRVGGHGGGNLIYRSTADAMRLNGTPEGPDASFSFYPNVGGDADFAVSKSISLTVRPDVTFTPGSDILALSAGVLIPLT